MKQILLSNGGFAVVDDKDFEAVAGHTWRLDHHGYVTRGTHENGVMKHIRLHTAIVGPAPSNMVTDHKNMDKLDNRRENLRFVTRRLNALNRQSGGVFKRRGVWVVQLFLDDGKYIFVYGLRTEQAARSIAALLRASLIYHELTKGDSDGQ